MSSAQSASFAAVPGNATPAPPSTPASAMLTTPALPTIPDLPQQANAPGFAARQVIAGQVGALPAQLAATRNGIAASTQQQLAGYGGWTVHTDDPTTPQDESLIAPSYDPVHGMGQRQLQAEHGANNQANAAGMLSSSFRNQNVASAVQRVNLEAQQIINQYAVAVNQAATQYGNQASSLVSQWAGLYGSDSAWLLNNPPPTPALPANDYNGSSSTNAQLEQGAAPYLAWANSSPVHITPAQSAGPNPIKGVNGGWGTTYRPPAKKKR